MDDILLVYITAANSAEAERIAETLVSERLAACENIQPSIRSIYRWRGAVERAEEAALLAKTRADRFEALRARVREIHSYEVPCIVAWPIARGHPAFLDWVREESAAPGCSDAAR